MKTVLQELIQWTIENAFIIEGQDGRRYVAIDHEEMRLKFDEWLELDKRQLIDFHVGVMKTGLINEGGGKWGEAYIPVIKQLATDLYDETFND